MILCFESMGSAIFVVFCHSHPKYTVRSHHGSVKNSVLILRQLSMWQIISINFILFISRDSIDRSLEPLPNWFPTYIPYYLSDHGMSILSILSCQEDWLEGRQGRARWRRNLDTPCSILDFFGCCESFGKWACFCFLWSPCQQQVDALNCPLLVKVFFVVEMEPFGSFSHSPCPSNKERYKSTLTTFRRPSVHYAIVKSRQDDSVFPNSFWKITCGEGYRKVLVSLVDPWVIPASSEEDWVGRR